MRPQRSYRSKWWVVPVTVLIVSVAWELGVSAGSISPLFFPAPTTILNTMHQLTVNGTLPENLAATLTRMTIGLLTGGTLGLLLGLAMGWSRRLRGIVDPFIAATHNIPKIAVFPLVMLIFGVGEMSKILLLSLSSFFPMVINSMAGVRQISRIHYEVAKNYGASPWKVLTRVILPGSLPMMLAGLRIACNSSLMITLAIELVASKTGLGVMIWFAWETLRTEQLYAALVITASLGIGFNVFLYFLTRRFVHWQVEREV